MKQENSCGFLIFAMIIVLGLLILIMVLPPHTDPEVRVNGTTAFVPAHKQLILIGNKVRYTIHRENYEIVIQPILGFEQRVKLCGINCTVKATVNLFSELKFTEEEEGAFTAEWPFLVLSVKH